MLDQEHSRSYPEAVSLRQREPYAFQRSRNTIHSSYPRAPQPAIQPNRLPRLNGWGMATLDYWKNLSQRKMR